MSCSQETRRIWKAKMVCSDRLQKTQQLTVDDKYPLPNISDLLDQLLKCQDFFTLDLASVFHQIKIDPKDRSKTAFSVENSHYKFVPILFGFKNTLPTFQRVMDSIFLGIQYKLP